MTKPDREPNKEIALLRRRNMVLESAVEFQGRKSLLQHKKLQTVIKINSILLSDRPVDSVLDEVLEEAMNLLSASGGSVMLRDAATDTLRICASRGISQAVGKTVHPKIGEGIAGWVALTGKTLLLSESTEDPRFKSLCVRENIKDALCVPLKANGVTLGVLNVRNSLTGGAFDEDDMELLTAFADQAAIAIEVARRKDEVEAIYIESVTALAEAVDARDAYTAGHAAAVRDWVLRLAQKAELDENRTHDLAIGAVLHDIGKIGIDDSILRKPGLLTDDEMALIKTHPIMAVRILEPLGSRHDIIPMIRHHHERFDGKGYPAGLVGADIPLEARMLAVADSYHAMASVRPYRDALTFDRIVSEFEEGRGHQFDPELVEAFLTCLDEVGVGASDVSDSKPAVDGDGRMAEAEADRTAETAKSWDSCEVFTEAVGILSETVFSSLEHLIGPRMTRQLEERLSEASAASGLGYGMNDCTLQTSNGAHPDVQERVLAYSRFARLQNEIIGGVIGRRLLDRLLSDSVDIAGSRMGCGLEGRLLDQIGWGFASGEKATRRDSNPPERA